MRHLSKIDHETSVCNFNVNVSDITKTDDELTPPRYNEAYTWTNPTCCVHNIIVGQLWIEQYGNVEVINHRLVIVELPG